MVMSTGGAVRTPPVLRRGPDAWDQYLIVVVVTDAKLLYPAFRAKSRILGVSVRLGAPIQLPNSGEVRLRFGVGEEPCEFGVAYAGGDGSYAVATLAVEYKVVREPTGNRVCLLVHKDPNLNRMVISEPGFTTHV